MIRSSLLLLTLIPSITSSQSDCPCQLYEQPNLREKERTARWMVHSLEWGVLSTVSTKFPGSPPFGNVYSFVDGPCHNSTGVPYFYGTYMDQSFQDILSNPSVSFTLSEASLSSVCGGSSLSGCRTQDSGGDPENPICARLTLIGKLRQVQPSEEYDIALNALFQRHQSFQTWPRNHNWVVAKLDVEHIWFIDYFGGADIMDVTQYFMTDLNENDPYQHNAELDPNQSK